MKHNNEHIVAKQCRVGFCSAKWKVKTWTRKDEAETVDYVLMACLTHDHSKGCNIAQSLMCSTNFLKANIMRDSFWNAVTDNLKLIG